MGYNTPFTHLYPWIETHVPSSTMASYSALSLLTVYTRYINCSKPSSATSPSTHRQRKPPPAFTMCKIYGEVCHGCRRIVYCLRQCFFQQGLCDNTQIEYTRSGCICHWCDIARWRELTTRCRILHNLLCRHSNKKFPSVKGYITSATTRLAHREAFQLAPRDVTNLRNILRILKGELIVDDFAAQRE